jgi:PHD/YefM family antitoxin component YafN of YafNO toxin-antitoxin module
MAEKQMSLVQAKQSLSALSQRAHRGKTRVVITHVGKPQSVLMGYQTYMGMKAAVELLQRPDVIANIHRGLMQAKDGERELWSRPAVEGATGKSAPVLVELSRSKNVKKPSGAVLKPVRLSALAVKK